MKKIALVIMTIALAVGCSSTKKATAKADTANSLSFEYTASTRGSYNKVIVTQDSVVTIKDHEMKNVSTKSLKKADWDKLVADTEKIDLTTLEGIKAPSTKHQFDGALGANLKVIKDGKEYNSATFDHGTPPAEIAGIVTRILTVSDLQKK